VLILVHRAIDKSPPSTPSMLPPELAPDYGE
jgi:hypothetical protein